MLTGSVLDGCPGDKRLMLGNEAIARGAIEAGVRVATAYPGTPSSEVLRALSGVASKYGIYVEWSTNEKVAFEVAYSASLTGVRAMAVMKHLGTHWVIDPLAVAAVTGIRGGLVLVSADDPLPSSSQSSVDTRMSARLVNIPAVEPSNPREAKELLKKSFELSEASELPVLFRYTEKVAHSKGVVELGERLEWNGRPEFVKDPDRFVSIAPHARRNIPKIFERLKKAESFVESEPFVERTGPDSGEVGLITAGVPHLYALEALEELGSELPVLKLSAAYPIPREAVREFLESVKKVLILEEHEPVIEDQVIVLAHTAGLRTKIVGKESGLLPRYGEYSPDLVEYAIRWVLGRDCPPNLGSSVDVPRRIPQLCAGCPHRGAYLAIKRVLRRRGGGVVFGDRGCYNQGVNPPLRAIDTCVAMGSSIAMAVGAKKAGLPDPAVAVIGDSTFFHAGIPPLIDASVNEAPIVVAVLDNSWTCMTGHQPSPATGVTAAGKKTVSLLPEDFALAARVPYRVVDPYNLRESEEALEWALEEAERTGRPAMVIFRRECVIQVLRRARRTGHRDVFKPLSVDPAKCVGCKVCVSIGCPAISFDGDSNKAVIDQSKCVGCSVCAQVCPVGAIGG